MFGVGAALLVGGALGAGRHPEGDPLRHAPRYTVPAAIGAGLIVAAIIGSIGTLLFWLIT